MPGPVAAPLADRFWAKVDKRGRGGCWLWIGATIGTFGYGQISGPRVNGRPAPKYAHRVAWELTHGSIPDGQQVCHSCDVPLCVNPSHLFLGTQRDNNRDAASKGRFHVRRPKRHKVTTEQLAEIDALLASGVKQNEIARLFSVSEGWVSQYAKGQRRQYDRPKARKEGAA